MIGRHRKSLFVKEDRNKYDRLGRIRLTVALPTQLVHAIGQFLLHVRDGLCNGFLVKLQEPLLVDRRNFDGVGRKRLVSAETSSDRCNKRKLEVRGERRKDTSEDFTLIIRNNGVQQQTNRRRNHACYIRIPRYRARGYFSARCLH